MVVSCMADHVSLCKLIIDWKPLFLIWIYSNASFNIYFKSDFFEMCAFLEMKYSLASEVAMWPCSADHELDKITITYS